jgi:hypothetical protein
VANICIKIFLDNQLYQISAKIQYFRNFLYTKQWVFSSNMTQVITPRRCEWLCNYKWSTGSLIWVLLEENYTYLHLNYW